LPVRHVLTSVRSSVPSSACPVWRGVRS